MGLLVGLEVRVGERVGFFVGLSSLLELEEGLLLSQPSLFQPSSEDLVSEEDLVVMESHPSLLHVSPEEEDSVSEEDLVMESQPSLFQSSSEDLVSEEDLVIESHPSLFHLSPEEEDLVSLGF